MDTLFVRYGDEKWYFDPPPGWKVLTFASFHDRPHRPDVAELTRSALNNPVRSAPLRKRLSPSDTVAIIIEDQTRASPKKIILKALLEELEEAGIPAGNISIVVALGTHRALTTREMETVYGEDAVRGYSFTNHDCQAPDLVPVGNAQDRRDRQDQPQGARRNLQDRDRLYFPPRPERFRRRGEDPVSRGLKF